MSRRAQPAVDGMPYEPERTKEPEPTDTKYIEKLLRNIMVETLGDELTEATKGGEVKWGWNPDTETVDIPQGHLAHLIPMLNSIMIPIAWSSWGAGWRSMKLSPEDHSASSWWQPDGWTRIVAIDWETAEVTWLKEGHIGPGRCWTVHVSMADGVTRPSSEQDELLKIAGFPTSMPSTNPDPTRSGTTACTEWADLLQLTTRTAPLQGVLDGHPKHPVEGRWRPHMPLPEPCVIHLYGGDDNEYSMRAAMLQETPHLAPHLVEIDLSEGANVFDVDLRARLVQHAMEGQVHAEAAGPNCGSWSVVRHRRGSRPLRAREEPENWWGLKDLSKKETWKILENNLLFSFAITMAVITQAAGGIFVHEHPQDPGAPATSSWVSYVWQKAARILQGIMVGFDACAAGGLCRKPTDIFTNLLCMMIMNDLRCTCTYHAPFEKLAELARWPWAS